MPTERLETPEDRLVESTHMWLQTLIYHNQLNLPLPVFKYQNYHFLSNHSIYCAGEEKKNKKHLHKLSKAVFQKALGCLTASV